MGRTAAEVAENMQKANVVEPAAGHGKGIAFNKLFTARLEAGQDAL